jgi:hypothetical protein
MKEALSFRAASLLLACLLPCVWSAAALAAEDRLRVIVETDIGGDADDQASLVRFLLYSNEWDVEAIIADRSADAFHRDGARDHKGLRADNGWELAKRYVEAYRQVYQNLSIHKPDYPRPDELLARTVPGFDSTNAGVRAIIQAADEEDDPRPIWYGNWGSNSGSKNNLRRAFDLVQATRSRAEYEAFVRKFRICTLDGRGPTKQGHDDQIVLHIETGYPEVDGRRWYHRFRPLTERAGDCDVRRDIQQDHGPLGAIYTTPKEGDSWTFVYLIPTGLGNPLEPTWGGWAGRYGPRGDDPRNTSGPRGRAFYWANQADTWNDSTSRDNTALRWATALQNDFRARLDWCVATRFEDANHEPLPHCQGDGSHGVPRIDAPAGQPLDPDASGTTDPDGDQLTYRWFVYREPGTYPGRLTIERENSPRPTLSIPADARGKSIHVVLEVTDNGQPPLTRYRRVVVTAR